jgi:hypothetical protein
MATDQRIAGYQAPNHLGALSLNTISGSDWRRELERAKAMPNDITAQVREILRAKGLTKP